MRIGYLSSEFEVEYTLEQIKGVAYERHPRFYGSEYHIISCETSEDGEIILHFLRSDAPEDLKKEFAAYAWRRVEAWNKRGEFLD